MQSVPSHQSHRAHPAPSVNEIVKGIFVGNYTSAHSKKFITENNITCIINCTNKIPFSRCNLIKHRYRVPVKDNLKPDEMYKLYMLFDTVINIINEHKNKEENGNILVHCHAGKQRSVSILIAYLMRMENMDPNGALIYVKSKRPEAGEPTLNFTYSLEQYYLSFRK